MARIFMDPDRARQVATQLRAIAKENERFAQHLSDMLYELEGVWKGKSPSDYIYVQRSQLSKIRSLIRYLYELADELDREIDQYIQVTSTFEY